MGAKTRKLSQINDSLIEWQSVVTASTLTAVAGRGYFIDTTSNACTVTFPASPKIGDTIIINDYASTFATNNVTINLNGNKLEASTDNGLLSTNDQTHTFVFTDTTQGWKIVNQDTGTSIQTTFISATGGTVTTSGNFKIHTFTGDGSFVVSQVGSGAGPSNVDYLAVAGGGGTGRDRGAGGGAGGYRTSFPSPGCNAGSFPISATTYPITVGAGGTGQSGPTVDQTPGNPSIFSTITSAGGGAGNRGAPFGVGGSGSGGQCSPGHAGNTPPVSPPQGNPGGDAPGLGGGGGGGAGAAGSASSGNSGGAGGAGAPNSISGSSVTYAGGGGGGFYGGGSPGPGGAGGGGSGTAPVGGSGTANTGGGAGGTPSPAAQGPVGASGGKGIVIIRYKYQ
jgi:hypothetical protein